MSYNNPEVIRPVAIEVDVQETNEPAKVLSTDDIEHESIEQEENEENKEENNDNDEEPEDEADPIDPMNTLREACAKTKHCSELMELFEKCEERVKSKAHTEETCAEEILDFFHCQDMCMAKDLFKHLK